MALGSRTRLELLEGLRTSPRELGECREHVKKRSRRSRSNLRLPRTRLPRSFYRPTERAVKLGVQTTCSTRPPPLRAPASSPRAWGLGPRASPPGLGPRLRALSGLRGPAGARTDRRVRHALLRAHIHAPTKKNAWTIDWQLLRFALECLNI